ncbi:oligosaccharide flippase family protein [Caviibacterium pharyngocola]|uniref:Polysaccharide biosynthesis protein n=1 Tax=Caviibacterium pharyngocola TaxID=28159 RepID=A0A2M8RXA3_9PAST|nr:oligosaccharide flippase family protein [Caviibacterium pharyngocola]PJG83510.1 hypothetical protein CVP04_03845 [Caviibacterium pharyngocola]
MKDNKTLRKNISYVLSSNMIIALIGLVNVFLFPKIMTVESYALYQSFMLYITYITICHAGFSTGMAINYAGKNFEDISLRRFKSEIFLLFLIVLFFFFFISIIYWYSRYEVFYYLVLVIIPYVLVGSYKSLLQSWNKFRYFTIINLFESVSIILISLLIYFIYNEFSGESYIYIYLSVYWVVFIYIFINLFNMVKKTESISIFSQDNKNTWRLGAIFVIGNYINILFIVMNKQVVQIFFSIEEFAYYSFGISLQTLIMLFVTSISQPLFTIMAKNIFSSSDYDKIKDLLIVFSSFSVCGYFVVSFIIKRYIPNYSNSLDITAIYFMAFPAIYIINCLYFNFYKYKKLTKYYVKLMSVMFAIMLALNIMAAYFFADMKYVAISTVVAYYIFLFCGGIRLSFITIKIKDILYLIVFMLSFIFINYLNNNDMLSLIYMFFLTLFFSIFFYKNSIFALIKKEI